MPAIATRIAKFIPHTPFSPCIITPAIGRVMLSLAGATKIVPTIAGKRPEQFQDNRIWI
jgi:hypothetical protein